MTEPLPIFRYHPDPVATGNVIESTTVCVSCGKGRGYVFAGSIFGSGDYDRNICPWCIADGSAAVKLDVSFGDVFIEGDVPNGVYEELAQRTPGFECWQSENWQVHCGDVCEFHGDVSKAEMIEQKPALVEYICSHFQFNEEEWSDFVEAYEPRGNPAVYKFICRHCREEVFYTDYT